MKKLFRSITAAALTTALLAVGGTAVKAEPEAAEMPAVSSVQAKSKLSKGFRSKYKKILDSYDDFSGVYIGDLMGDEREELVVAVNTLGIMDIYVPEGKVIKKYHFDVMSVWGYTKYNKAERTIVNMAYYGHTEGSPYELDMRSVAFEDGDFSVLSVHREEDFSDMSVSPRPIITKVNGEVTDNAYFSIVLNLMIAETAETEFIPLVEHHKGDLTTDPGLYSGEVIDTDYETYIREKLG